MFYQDLKNYVLKRRNLIAKLLLILICVVFSIYKIPYLSLPTYNDETWVYSPAAMQMAKNGLSILPDAIDPDLSRGHPLLFHFIGAMTLKLFGVTVLNLHIVSFIIALTLLIVFFFLSKKIAKNSASVLCLIVLVLQPIFVAQSGMFLPEILLSLLGLLCIYFYVEEKAIQFNIVCVLLLFTKESGLILVATLGFYTLIIGLKNDGVKLTLIRAIIYFLLPCLLISLFFISQHSIQGWFFFPDHLKMISFKSSDIIHKIENILAYSFIYQGRNLLAFSFLLFLFWKLYRKVKFKEVIINDKYEEWLVISFLFFLFYSLFCMVNFYTERYLLIQISFFLLLSAIMINELLKPFWLKGLFVIIFVFTQFHFLSKRSKHDHNLGYIDEIKTFQDIVQTAKENKWQEKIISADYFPDLILTKAEAGYLTENELFKNDNISYCADQNYEIYICYWKKLEEIECPKPNNIKLLRSIKHGKSTAEIYKVMP